MKYNFTGNRANRLNTLKQFFDNSVSSRYFTAEYNSTITASGPAKKAGITLESKTIRTFRSVAYDAQKDVQEAKANGEMGDGPKKIDRWESGYENHIGYKTVKSGEENCYICGEPVEGNKPQMLYRVFENGKLIVESSEKSVIRPYVTDSVFEPKRKEYNGKSRSMYQTVKIEGLISLEQK